MVNSNAVLVRMKATWVLVGSATPFITTNGNHARNSTTHRQMLKTKKTRTRPLG
jgi:hypothetical protein